MGEHQGDGPLVLRAGARPLLPELHLQGRALAHTCRQRRHPRRAAGPAPVRPQGVSAHSGRVVRQRHRVAEAGRRLQGLRLRRGLGTKLLLEPGHSAGGAGGRHGDRACNDRRRDSPLLDCHDRGGRGVRSAVRGPLHGDRPGGIAGADEGVRRLVRPAAPGDSRTHSRGSGRARWAA